jgi:flagella basal body P-ring formation protein FlgA
MMGTMTRSFTMRCCLFPALLFAAALANGADVAPAWQDGEALRQLAQAYLEQQSAGLPGQVTVTLGPLDGRKLAPCSAPQAFQPPGARAWGKTTVAVRCAAPAAWTVYIQAKVAVLADYVATAAPLAAGQTIEQNQLVTLQGDIAAMPGGIVTDPQQAIGHIPAVSLAAGAPLRLDMLRSKPVVQQGQLVRVVSNGNGFQVSAEGRAIGNAADGQPVQVRTTGGQVVSGVAHAGGLVQVLF